MTRDGKAGESPALRDWEAAAAWARGLRAGGRKLVFTNGCFDIIHAGHVHLLRAAASFGDALAVGLNTDDSVRRIKGASRPLTGEEGRAEVLLALRWVDRVVLFDEDTPLSLIKTLRPDVLVKGGDYTPETVVGATEAAAWGGRVEIVALRSGFSTSSLIQRLEKGEPS